MWSDKRGLLRTDVPEMVVLLAAIVGAGIVSATPIKDWPLPERLALCVAIWLTLIAAVVGLWRWFVRRHPTL